MKLSKYIVGFVNIFFVLLFLVIFKLSINIRSVNLMNLALFTIGIFFIYHIIKKIPDKFYDAILTILFIAIILLQLTYVFLYASIPSFDLGEIYNSIDESIIYGKNLCEYEYFNRFTNNGLLGLILKLIFSVMNLFNNLEGFSTEAIKIVLFGGIAMYATYIIVYYFLGKKFLQKGVNVD